MLDRRIVQTAATGWAVVGFAIAAAALVQVDPGSRVLVGVASVLFPLCAVLAAVAVERNRPRAAGVLLLLSGATPTYFMWVVNLFPLMLGAALVLAPRRTVLS